MAGPVSFLLLAAVVVLVTLRPSGKAEVTVALPAALIVVIGRLAPWRAVRRELRFLAPTLVFLAAVFVIAEVAAAAGVFDAAGRTIGRLSGSSPRRLVLVVAVGGNGHDDRLESRHDGRAPHAGGNPCRAPPSYRARRRAARERTGATVAPVTSRSLIEPVFIDESRVATLDSFGRAISLGLVVLLAAFFVGSLAHVAPSAIAATGAAALAVAAMWQRRTTASVLVRAASPGFLVFVAALGIVVAAATQHGLDDAVGHLLPAGTGLAALLGVALVAAVLANAVNNLPATLVLLSALPVGAAAPLLAALIGVNIGPNLTYTGSLATLLWRKRVRAEGAEPSRRAFFTAAVVATPSRSSPPWSPSGSRSACSAPARASGEAAQLIELGDGECHRSRSVRTALVLVGSA